MSNTPSKDYKIYNYEEVRALVNRPISNVVLIDVREPEEFAEVRIPTSINIPYRSHPQGLALDAPMFEATFKITKPSLNSEMVIFCASGRRASEAREVALKGGYKTVSLYPGSIKDWVARGSGKL
ncbi:related to Thiosulfate sulfurtransferase RDL1, mitochondrial [Zygosaccharomyces bailii]|nr:related to Thiosulfate sulfurtransferase RDL1, mitochondrial [Zygosaccharomyces bailii]